MIVTAAVAAAALLAAAPAAAQVRIQEVLYDGAGSDVVDVFTELSGPAGTSLDGWSLVGVNGGDGEPYRTIDLSGSAIPADGILVVATSKANPGLAVIRDLTGSVDWQNGPDAVQLRDPNDQIVDALQFGDAGAFNAGEGTPAPTTPAGHSLSRDAAGTDTGDNAADFSILQVPTPGTAVTEAFLISLPDTTAGGGDTLAVPVRFTDSSAGGVLAAEVFVAFDGGLLSPLGVKPAGLFDAREWQLASNTLEGDGTDADTLRIAMATDTNPLSGDGTLVRARFLIADLRRPAATGLTIEHLSLNDGSLPAGGRDGAVTLVGSDARLAHTPTRVVMHDSLSIAVTDPDLDRDPQKPDTLAIYLRQRTSRSAVGTPDTLTAVETGISSGTFASRLAVLHQGGAPRGETVPADAVRTWPGRRLQLCFDDSLDAGGATTRRCTVLAVPAHDARLDATVVAEPGDTLWMRLIDADANERPRAVDTASIKLINGEDTRTVSLEETGLSDSVFFGHLVTGDRLSVAGRRHAASDLPGPAQHRRHGETGLRHHSRPRPLRRRRRQLPAAGLRRLPHPQPRAGSPADGARLPRRQRRLPRTLRRHHPLRRGPRAATASRPAGAVSRPGAGGRQPSPVLSGPPRRIQLGSRAAPGGGTPPGAAGPGRPPRPVAGRAFRDRRR